MTKDLQKYIQLQQKQRQKLEEEILIKKRSLELVNQKLSNPELYLSRELQRGAVKVSKALGLEVAHKPKTILKKNVDVKGTDPEPVTEVPAPGAAVEVKKEDPKKKSGWTVLG